MTDAIPDAIVDGTEGAARRRTSDADAWRRFARTVLPFVLAGALGLAWWSLAMLVGQPHLLNRHDSLWPVFGGLTAATGVAAGLLWRGPLSLTWPMGAVAVNAAWASAPRAFNTPLQVLVGVAMIVWLGVVLGVERTVRAATADRGRIRRLRVGTRWLAVATAGTVALGAGLYARLGVYPWEDLTARLAGYPVPAGFAPAGPPERSGDPRCLRGCSPRLDATWTTSQGLAGTCRDLKSSLEAWPGITLVWLIEKGAEEQGCTYYAKVAGNGVVRSIEARTNIFTSPVELTVSVRTECVYACTGEE